MLVTVGVHLDAAQDDERAIRRQREQRHRRRLSAHPLLRARRRLPALSQCLVGGLSGDEESSAHQRGVTTYPGAIPALARGRRSKRQALPPGSYAVHAGRTRRCSGLRCNAARNRAHPMLRPIGFYLLTVYDPDALKLQLEFCCAVYNEAICLSIHYCSAILPPSITITCPVI